MNTHDVAKILSALAQALRSAPNQPLESFFEASTRRRHSDPSSIPMALSTLVALSDYDKQQWSNVLREYDFPIDVRPRDASRDVIGKLLKYLEQNPEARKKLTNAAHVTRSKTSPELLKALQFLLKQ